MNGAGALVARYNSPSAPLSYGADATRMLGASSATTVRPAISIMGGRRKGRTCSRRGGFYPAVMGSMAKTGVYLVPPAIRNVYLLATRKRKCKRRNKSRKQRKQRKQKKQKKL